MNVLQALPPPIFSDGKKDIIQNARNQGWKDQDALIPVFMKQILVQLKDLCTQFPEQMNPPMPSNTFTFSPNVNIVKLPENYALLTKDNTVIIVGHPR
jgi:hypothetical protein